MKSSAAERLAAIQADPVRFCIDELGFEPWSKQRAVLESVRDHRRTAVRSAHGVGKTAVAAHCVLWWMVAWPGSVVVTTSATWTQVREQLWREVAAAVKRSSLFSGWTLTDTRLEANPDHFALGLSTNESEKFAGYHRPRLLVVLDEASRVPEPVWEAAETLITTPGSRLLAIGNPTRPSGSFYRAFTSERALYSLLSISALESPKATGERVSARAAAGLVDPMWIEERRRAWGVASPLWAVRVLGQFASSSDDTVCSIEDVEQAAKRRLPAGVPVAVAADIARFGSDETAIVTRRGARVRIARSYVGRDLMRTVGEILVVARELSEEAAMPKKFVRLVVDDAGLGGGVTDRLREIGEFPVVAFNAGERAHRGDDYPNRRSESWFGFSEQLPDLDLDGDEQLAADLVAPRYALDSRGRRVVEAKSETKKRLGRSPDVRTRS